MTNPVLVTITVDTEEDDWGSYQESGASTRNISLLPQLQELFDRWGARPTYLVNLPPLLDNRSVAVLKALAEAPSVEIGCHCHPWHTPPLARGGEEHSMMCRFSTGDNRRKIREITSRIEGELGAQPKSFRAGRWGFGPTVARALAEEGYLVDASVTPFLNWAHAGGPDFSAAPHEPYRFHPDLPLVPDDEGTMVELPATVGFLRGGQRSRGRLRALLLNSPTARRARLLGLLDRTGLLSRRRLCPESSSAVDLVRLADAWVRTGQRVLDLTFHSCTLLPGATPFVSNDEDKSRFMLSIETFLRHCRARGYQFRTLAEVADALPRSRPAADLRGGEA